MSNPQKKNVPELRFPEFEGEWEEKQLGDTLEFIKDGTHGTHENVNNGPWLLSAKNIKNNKIIISSDDRKISESDYKKIYKNYKLEKGDLLLTIVGTIGRAAIVKNPNNIAFQRSVAILKTKATYDVEFIFQLFQTKYFKNLLLRKQVVSAQPGLYLGDIRKIKISITNIIEEQRKIGTFFRKIDRQIELEEQKLELLQQQKKGYMQKIFSQELRFKDENGNDYPEWVVKLIGDIGKVAMNKRIYKHETSANEEIPFYKIGNFGKKADTFISREQFNEYKEKYPYPKKGDILISASGSIGKTIEYKGEEAYYQDSNIVWLDHNEEVLNVFLKYFYILVKWNGVEGTTIKRLYNKNILNTKIDLPTISEQQKIGDFFGYIDNLIEIHERKLEFLKQRKQSLLQKMFV
ncbi:TPA: restriction endonuclease subunit S [Staphylococcus aureus]|nr:restriction endonuclease subunit S [Staphylococcus aureus]HDJ3214819.1 restriction endonuclease subunit S [Staphylococcus aureus]